MPKIKRNNFHLFIFLIFFLFLIYSRFVGLGWGLPYPIHPDERNMAMAIQGLNCKLSIINFRFSITDCFNPHFFAYGQFPLYLGYFLIMIYHWLTNQAGQPIKFIEAAMTLRLISAAASVVNVLVLIEIIKQVLPIKLKIKNPAFYFLFFTLTPYFIQFSHFGTTESLLMLFYSIIILLSLKILKFPQSEKKTLPWLIPATGLAAATKISSVIFLIPPALVMLINKKRPLMLSFLMTSQFVFASVIVAVILSPQNIISFSDFLGSIKYESDVAFGNYLAFYTRQFAQTTPIVFQLLKIFPYALGWPQYLLSLFGFLFLPWKKEINFLRLAFLIYFLPQAFFFAKWTRFMAPVIPLISVLAVLCLISISQYIDSKISIRFAFYILIFALIIPGVAYLSVYQSPDVRFIASDWIYKNIPAGSYILSETANVVDIPIPNPATNNQFSRTNYQYVSFNFYDLDQSRPLQQQLQNHLQRADYIFVPSRRIFANHTCLEINNEKLIIKNYQRCHYLEETYPHLNEYYNLLLTGELGFEKVAEFSSYPKIKLFNKTLVEFPDEAAEESWTVFDHPVVRIYQKKSNPTISDNFINYASTSYQLGSKKYRLLVADTPEKWTRGLMSVTKPKDFDGMLFVFPDKQKRTFWNKNTYLDLTLYWLDDNLVVGRSSLPSVKKTGNTVTLTSSKPVNKVIEIIKD